ncbi:hypothetical protein NMG60_11026470 [Bertholletia excelsa]
MGSLETQRACADHKLSMVVDKEKKLKQLRRAQWLRSAYARCGAAKEDQRSMILSGLAGAVAGAFSMAIGVFFSVSTQGDIEEATVSCPASKDELEDDKGDIKLGITTGTYATYTLRKSSVVLASVNSPMMKVIGGDAEMAEEEREREALPNPYKAAVASALEFLAGSVVPLLPALFLVHNLTRVMALVVVTAIGLGLLGGLGACIGGCPISVSAIRVLRGAWVSMAITYGLLKPLDREKNGHDHYD